MFQKVFKKQKFQIPINLKEMLNKEYSPIPKYNTIQLYYSGNKPASVTADEN